MLSLVNFAKQVLDEKFSVTLFWSMFIVSIKGDYNRTYPLSRVDKEVKGKFNGLFSKVCDLKANFIVIRRLVAFDPTNDTLPV